jgi:hypothetical protein
MNQGGALSAAIQREHVRLQRQVHSAIALYYPKRVGGDARIGGIEAGNADRLGALIDRRRDVILGPPEFMIYEV